MSPVLRSIIAVLMGVIIGMSVNMGLVLISDSVIAVPEGADMTTTEGIAEAMSLLKPKHFIMPFLAHAIGTLVGAWFAALIAPNYKMRYALGIGVWFLAGGIMMTNMVPSPTWFIIVDLVFAYIPMGLIGGMLAMRIQTTNKR
jgi:hypothetical protein